MNERTPDPLPVVRCHDTADFLAALPRLVGYTATDSIFLVLFSGKRTGRTLRLDLPSDEQPQRMIALLDFICDAVHDFSEGPPDRPAVVIACERTFAESKGAPYRRLAKRIERRLRREGLPPRELCCIAPDGWVGYFEPDPPLLGHPLSQIAASPITREAAYDDRPVPALSDLGEIPRPDARRARAVATALADLPKYTEPSVDPAEAETARRRFSDRMLDFQQPVAAAEAQCPETHYTWLSETADVGRAMLGPDGAGSERPLSPRMTARLIRTVEHPDRWFVLAIGLITRAEFPLELAREAGPHHLAALRIESEAVALPGGTRMVGGSMHRFLASVSQEFTEHRRARALCRALLQAIAECPAELRPGLLALSAWLWWMSGSQTVADRHLREARALDPAHELSLMVGKLVDRPACLGRGRGRRQFVAPDADRAA